MITKREFLFKTLPVALGAALATGMDSEVIDDREEKFKRRILEDLKDVDEPSLHKEIRRHFQFEPSDRMDISYIVEKREAKQDEVVILQPVPQLALGCVLIVIAVTIIAFGVIIYLIIQACKAPNGSTNAPPRIPPDGGGTNYGPKGPFWAHNGGVGIGH